MSHIDGSYRTNFASNTRTQEVGGTQTRALKGNPSVGVGFMRKIESGASSSVKEFIERQGGPMTYRELLGLTPDQAAAPA